MNQKVLSTLEFYKIRDLLVEKADSAPGKQMCQELEPICEFETINLLQTQTQDA